jgi:hypothetical protein
MQTWQDFRFHQLVEVPQPDRPGPGEEPDDTANALFTALTGAHADLLGTGDLSGTGNGAPALLTAWVRPVHGRALRLLLGGRPYFPPAGGRNAGGQSDAGRSAGGGPPTRRQRVLFPPGAVAIELPAAEVGALLDEFPAWVCCAGRPDSLWVRPEQRPRDAVRRGAFDRYAAHLRDPFAWLVIAEPLRPHEVQPDIDRLVNEILPLTRGEVSEAKKVSLERWQARHRELARNTSGGMWRIRLLVGGVDAPGAGVAAAMLCAASEMEALPYVMAPVGGPVNLATALRCEPPASFTASTELLVALTRPPSRELAGVRLVQPHSFDVTPEAAEPGGLHVGSVIDEAGVEVGDMVLSRGSLVRHTFVCGATGAGKSHTVRHLLAQASRAGLPWLAVEPAKAEYARMAARVAGFGGEVIVVRPSDVDRAPGGLNPLEPAPGFPLQTHADLLRALFLASFEAQEPFPQILAAAIQRCYEELGWDLTLGEPVHAGGRPRYPTLADLQRVAQIVVDEIGYGQEVSDNVRGFIKVRLDSLRLGTTGRFFEGGHPIDFDELLTRNVVLEIEDVGDDADKAFFMGIMLMRLAEHLRVASRHSRGDVGLQHLTVIEEAHRLLRQPPPGAVGPSAHAVEMFAAMLAEVRAYGEGLVIAEQIPSKLITDVIKNTAVKIVHRLPARDDRESVGATMNLDEKQSSYLVTLRRGVGAVFADEMDRPVLVEVTDGSALESVEAATAPIAAIIGRRSGTCGTDCIADACTLRDMRAAQHLLTERPWLTLWAELTVLAHLTGYPAPMVEESLRRTVEGAVPARVLHCAVSHAVDDAVAVRSALLQPTVAPADLAAHCAAVLRAQLAGGTATTVCAADAYGFLADAYKWVPVRDALRAFRHDDGPHPDTADWERRFRRWIPGTTRAEQFAVVDGWWSAVLTDQPTRDAVTFGTRRPSAVEAAIGGAAADTDWDARLPDALAPFVDCDWPATHLIPADRQSGE